MFKVNKLLLQKLFFSSHSDYSVTRPDDQRLGELLFDSVPTDGYGLW